MYQAGQENVVILAYLGHMEFQGPRDRQGLHLMFPSGFTRCLYSKA